MSLYNILFKRLIDIIISGIALILLSPIFLIIYILVRIKLGAPVFFIQPRPGMNEKVFNMYKFRTMTDSNDNLLSDEQRLTKFGLRLRASSLDELPELWNIFKGDMSLVGPRPLLVSYLPLYSKEQRKRHNVRPGLTGLAQVKGRNSLTWNQKFAYDVDYVNGISFKTDIYIIFSTIKTIIKKEGISSQSSQTMEPFKGDKDE